MQASEVLELSEIVVEACHHVLPQCGIPIEAIVAEPKDVSDEPNRQLAAFIGFGADILRGSLTIVAPTELIRRSHPIALDDSTDAEIAVLDWSGEVANRLLGRIKLMLSTRGLEVEPSTPKAMFAQQLQFTPAARSNVCAIRFATYDSWVRVWLDAISVTGVTLFKAPAAQSEAPPEGDVLLF